MCASDAYMKRKLYMEAEEALLRCREISAREGKARIERDCLSRLGVLYGEQGRIDDLVSAWDDYISLNAAPIFLTDPMLDLAEKAFAAGDYERAHALVSRVERHHAGRGYGRLSLDRSWIPDLYVKLGQPAHAEQIFVARLATLHASWELADELEHYAAFLSSQGRLDEAKRMRERAAALRDGNSSD
jgi:tetratricopeptide (TPR) repeat protein